MRRIFLLGSVLLCLFGSCVYLPLIKMDSANHSRIHHYVYRAAEQFIVADVYADSISFDPDSLSMYHIQTGTTADSLDTFWLSGTTDIEDYFVISSSADANKETDTSLQLGDFIAYRHIGVHAPYLADSVNAFAAGWEIKSARLEMYENGLDLSAGTVHAYYMVKPFLESEATYNDWDNPNKEWGTAGIQDTGSTWNQTDNGGDDRGGTSQGSTTQAANQWNYIDLDTAWINNCVTLDSTCKWIIQGAGFMAYHSSEYLTDTTKTLRIRIIMEKPGSDLGTDNDYGSDTLVNLGKDTDGGLNWTAHGILGFRGLDELLSGKRVDSIVCSTYVSTFDDTAYYLIHQASSTKSNAESKSFGSAADSCETTWALHQKGGGSCTGDSAWSDSGGDYNATAIDSFYFTKTGWNVQTFSGWTYVTNVGPDSIGYWAQDGCDHDPVYKAENMKINLSYTNATAIRKMIISVQAKGQDGVSDWLPQYMRFYISNDSVYDSTDLDRSVGGDRLSGQCALGRPMLTVQTNDTTVSESEQDIHQRKFIFDYDQYQDEFLGPGYGDSTNEDWTMYLNSVGQKSIMLDITDADNGSSASYPSWIDTVWYTKPNGIVDYFQAVIDGSTVVDHELRGSENFFSQINNLFIINDNDDLEIQLASDDNATNPPKFWIYYDDIPVPVPWRYGTLTQDGYYYKLSTDSSGINIPLSGGPTDE